jgi:hypothetical protein
MRRSNSPWLLVASIALIAAALACTAPSAQPSAPAGKTVSAGIKTEYFTPYTIVAAPGWADTHESDPSRPFDKLTLTRGDYSLNIVQAGAGIEACIFGGAPTPTGIAQLWQEYPTGVSISGVSAQYMRGTSDGKLYIVCVEQGSGFASMTPFGGIMYTVPSPADPATLAEMDGMVASLRQ